MKISVALIVKNEEKMLSRCLESVKDADEIVISDTGSKDKTVEIAKKYTDKVYTEFEWCDHFAKARNFVKGKCTGDWILSIDADEWLENNMEEVREAAKKAEEKGFKFVNVRNISDSKTQHLFFPFLFKNDPDVVWKGAAHNYLTDKKGGQKFPMASKLSISYGYSPAHLLDPNRTLRILSKKVKENPKLARETYYLAREYYYRKKYKECIKYCKRYIKISEFRAEKADAYLMMARCLWPLQRGNEAREACLQAIGINPNFKEALEFMSEMYYEPAKSRWASFAALADNTHVLFVRNTEKPRDFILDDDMRLKPFEEEKLENMEEVPMSLTKDCLYFMENLLQRYKKLDVLEWGAGYSTKHFPSILANSRPGLDTAKHAIWYVPHPDDETLFMGASMYSSGLKNIVVLLTQGGASGEKKPRVEEFKRACSHLKVDEIEILDYEDGALKEEDVASVIERMEKKYPKALHNTMSYNEKHSDHKVCGVALAKAYFEDKVTSAEFYNSHGSNVELTPDSIKAKEKALKEYMSKDSASYKSAKRLFDKQIEKPTESSEVIGVEYTWKAIEHDKDWYEKVKSWDVPGVELIHADVDSKEYLEPTGKFDIIYVDGRNRVECLKHAKKILKPGGYVLLHDAERVNYKPGLEGYHGVYIGGQESHPRYGSPLLWVGKLEPMKTIPKTIHQIWVGPREVPKKWMDTWKEKNPNFKYKLWTEKEIEKLDLQNRELYDMFMKDKCYSGASDVARAEILLKEGGIYIDADTECVTSMENAPFMAWDFFGAYSFDLDSRLNNSPMGCTPGHPYMKKYVEAMKDVKEIHPPWLTVGRKLLEEVLTDYDNILPACSFAPEHHSGFLNREIGLVYGRHYWGTTQELQTNKKIYGTIK